MHALVYLNHKLVEAAKAQLPGVSSATLYGRGVFTTLAVYETRLFLWPEHWARLADHAGRMGLDRTGFDRESIAEALAKLVEANRVREGRARVNLFANTERGLWRVTGGGQPKTVLLVMTGDRRASSEDGLALTISPCRINTFSPLAGIKSINYLEHILAWEEARSREFDEAVMLNERGEVVAATMANIFWATDGTLHTPSLATGALAGITRACVIQLAAELSIPLVEGVYEISDLAAADEIFLTSSGRGVAMVTTFDFRRYTVPVGSVTLRVREAFRQLTMASA